MDPISWNTDRETLPDGKLRHEISCRRWKNFRKPGGAWERIDTGIAADRTIANYPISMQFPLMSQDWAGFVFDSQYSVKRKVEENNDNNNEPEFLLDVLVETQRNVPGVIGLDGNLDQIAYPNAWDGADLIYEVNRNSSASVRKLVRINSEPSGNGPFVTYSFLMKSPHAKAFVGASKQTRPWTGTPGDTADLLNESAFLARGDSQIRGSALQTPRCWYTKTDGEVVSENVKISFVITGTGNVRATKHVPRSMIKAAMAEGVPLYTDATYKTDDAGATGSDHVSERTPTSESWATITSANGDSWSDSLGGVENMMWINASSTSGEYKRNNRFFTFFDTSAASGTVDTVDWSVYGHGGADSKPWLSAINVFGTTSTGTTDGANSDYESIETTAFSTEKAWYIGTGSYNAWTLNTSGEAAIDVDGFSRFSAGSSTYDFGGSTPTWGSSASAYYQIRLSEYSGDFGPKLDLTTIAPASIEILRRRLESA